MNLRRISLLTLLLTFHILLAQQVHSVRTFGLSNGLSSSMTFDIFKDQYGFIWTSTRLGIDCFDGQNFKHFSLNKNDMRMADDGVRHDLLYIDGTIYVFSDLGKTVAGGYQEIAGNGLDKRYRETRGFQMIPNTQIILSEDVLTQTPGFGGDDTKSWLFSNGNLPYK